MEQNLKKIISDFIEKCRVACKKPLLLILGPTASGKTALSLEIAREFGGEIISADSRQIYKRMDIGTDKIPFDKREGIPHHLIDVVEPDERFTAADFKLLAEEKIEEILARGRLPMLVGGTGLYIRIVVQNFALPKENPAVREKLTRELEKFGKEFLYEKLKKLDPDSAAKIHKNNVPYVMRALEILEETGKPKHDRQMAPKYECLLIGLFLPKEKLFERINARAENQIKRGLVEETRELLKTSERKCGCGKSCAFENCIGYKEISQYLKGSLSLDEALEILKKNTRNFAKRQMTWFKKEPGILWIPAEKISA